MSRRTEERLADLCRALARALSYRPWLDDEDTTFAAMAFDAIEHNLAVAGEALKGVPDGELVNAGDFPWPRIRGLRDVVVHEYFRIDAARIRRILDDDVEPLLQAVRSHLDLQ